MAAPTFSDLELRVSNAEDNKAEANSWASQEDLENVIKFRMDAELYDDASDAVKVRAIVSAYRDLDKLVWNSVGSSQNRQSTPFDLGFNDAPFGDVDWEREIIKAQAAQVMYILSGTHVRDLAAQGVSMTRALTGVETEIQGYRGPVCVEALELLAEFVEMTPRVKRMR